MIIRLKYKYGKHCSRESLKKEMEVNAKCRSFNFEKDPSVSTNPSKGQEIFLHSKNQGLSDEYSDKSVTNINNQSVDEDVRTELKEVYRENMSNRVFTELTVTNGTPPISQTSVNQIWAPLLHVDAQESDI